MNKRHKPLPLMSEDSTSTIRVVAIAIAANFIPATIIPFALERLKWITSSEAIILGTIVMVFLTATEILFMTKAIDLREEREFIIWNIQNDFEARLTNIREAYRKILAGNRRNPDLFERFFEERVLELEQSITEAANRDQLHVSRGHLLNTNVILEGFNGNPSDMVRTIHFFEDNDWFFGVFNKRYFYQVYQLIQENQVKGVKKLFLYRNIDELNDEKTKNLIKFHSVTPNYDYKLMSVDAFLYILRDFRLDVPRDFGIYGDFIIYIGEDYRPDNVIGYYMRSSQTLKSYTDFFEACWSSPISTKAKNIDLSTPLSIDDLFEN